MKKSLKSVLSVCLICSLLLSFPFSVAAADTVREGSCGADLTWKLDSDNILTISGTGEMTDYDMVAYRPWGNDIVGVVIEPGITYLGKYAFAQCTELKSVVIPETVTFIGYGAFSRCTGLESVTLHEGLKTIYNSAFYNCSSLSSINLPDTLTYIDTHAFYGCSSLTTLTIPTSVTTIGQYAFYWTDLQTVYYKGTTAQRSEMNIGIMNDTLHNALYYQDGDVIFRLEDKGTVIRFYTDAALADHGPGETFWHDRRANITQVFLHEDCTGIGSYSFAGFVNLECMYIGPNVTHIDDTAFLGCAKLSIHGEEGSYVQEYAEKNNIPFSFDHRYISKGTASASCEKEGYDLYECSLCLHQDRRNVVDARGHSEFTVAGKEATCLTTGLTDGVSCSRCRKMLVEQVEIPVLPHTVVGDSGTPATCTKPGRTDGGYCSVCFELIPAGELPVDPQNHSWNEGAVTVEPTEEAEGMKTYTCTECGTTREESLEKLEHVHSFIPEVIEPGCETWGYTVHTCRCGETYESEETDPKGHSWDEGVVTVAPTEETEGVQKFTCTVCGDTKEENLPVLEHVHSYTSEVTAPTCTEQGFTAHTCRCGDSYTDAYVDAMGHSWDEGVVTEEPTEQTEGSKTYTCTACGENRAETIPALEHEHVYEYSRIDPTCTQEGVELLTCGCGEQVVYSTTPALGHSFGLWTIDSESVLGGEAGTKHRACECGETETATYTNPLVDVPNGKYFSKPIFWAYENGITKGKTATEFQRDVACTRKQIVTFLWRAAGCPEPASMENPFTDVKNDQFEKAILWAYYFGITKGTSATEFSPENPCTRKQIVMFLWRFNECPEPANMENPFEDVKRGDQFEKAILWALGEGITTGKTETTFQPDEPCTRGQIVTFLYRSMA